jgi:multicomponent K+:H+ antiporter subunit D
VGFARAGSTLFWKSTAVPVPATAADPRDEDDPAPPRATATEVAPSMAALAALALLAVFAGPVSAYLDGTSAQLYDRDGYIAAVLGTAEEG